MILYQINPSLTIFNPITINVVEKMEIVLESGSESPESVIENKTKGMDCFYEKYGNSKEQVEKQLVNASFMGNNFRLNPKAAAALKKADEEIKNKGIAYKVVNGGSYAPRANANAKNLPSMHSFGLAFDINTKNNPNYRRTSKCTSNCGDSCKTDIPKDVINALKNNGFRWGGEFSRVCDAMHFEWIEECTY